MTKIDDTGCPLAFFFIVFICNLNLWGVGVMYAKFMKDCKFNGIIILIDFIYFQTKEALKALS